LASLWENLLIRPGEQLPLEPADFALAHHAPMDGNRDLQIIHDLDLQLEIPRKERDELTPRPQPNVCRKTWAGTASAVELT
jgi:hypothetical protein